MKLTGSGVLALAGLIAAAIGFFYFWSKKEQIADALNPASNRNIVSVAAGDVVAAATGGAAAGGEDTVGGLFARFREWVSGDSAKIDAMKKGKPSGDPFNPYSINPRDRT